MLIKRFDAFARQLQKNGALQGLAELHDVYVRCQDNWRDSQHAAIDDDVHKFTLDRVLSRNHHWRGPHSLRAFFPVPLLKAVVAVQTATPSRAVTRNKIQRIIADVLKHSSDEFDALHDGLTGLANSRLIEECVRQASAVAIPATPAEGLNLLRTIALIALDIDHFKQINDSYGHDYGDLVLRCLAQRLEHAAAEIRSQFTDIEVVPGRLSGEEFVILLSGTLSATTIGQIAEHIRLAIADTPLPTDAEWAAIPGEQRSPTVVLPHIAERKITVSLGVSSILTPSLQPKPAMIDLRREADAALYRAKGGGRNTVRWFPEIRDKYGSVLEHHADTGVVVIDIGSHVNVRPGNEFFVFHPDFTGDKNFVFSDGRTQKRLGTYPRMTCGRIVVFDVQPEISFATVEQTDIERMPVGATIEYIPVGSIAHLLPKDSSIGVAHGVSLASVDDLDAFVKQQHATEDLHVIVFTLDDVQNLERARGVVFINKALAGLFESIQELLPRDVLVAQIQSNSFAVGFVKKIDTAATIKDVLAKARARAADVATFGAGIFVFQPPTEDTRGDASKLDPKRALDLARYAALPLAREPGKVIEIFSTATALRLLYAQRQAQRVKEVRADYKAFKEAGVADGSVETQVALTELTLGNFEAALSFANRACELDPADDTFQANKALVEFGLGHRVEAHHIFEAVAEREFSLGPAYLPARALAAFEEYKTNHSAVARETLEQLLETAKKDGAYPVYLGIKTSDIDLAAATVRGTVTEGSNQPAT